MTFLNLTFGTTYSPLNISRCFPGHPELYQSGLDHPCYHSLSSSASSDLPCIEPLDWSAENHQKGISRLEYQVGAPLPRNEDISEGKEGEIAWVNKPVIGGKLMSQDGITGSGE